MSTLEWPRHFKSGVNLGVCRRRLFVFSLRRGHAEKCKAGRTTDLPALRHGLGIGGGGGQPKGLRRPPPPRHRPKKKTRYPCPHTLEGGMGRSLFHTARPICEPRAPKNPPKALT